MANEKHLAILRQGVDVWNAWREENPDVAPDLTGADLSESHLTGVNLTRAILVEASLTRANLTGASLTRANLTGTNLTTANLTRANLARANLARANLTDTLLVYTLFADVNLSQTKGLDSVHHAGPSTVGIDTLVSSGGKIPESFLYGCGVPNSFIEYLPSLLGAMEPIQFYSCFISYSTKDEEFAKRLHSKMRDNNLRVWFAPEDMKSGQKIHEQIDQAIRIHDKLVLILSEESIQSPWVETEIRKARKAELRDNRRKLFPIRLMDFDTLRDWECFDADTGKDLAVELREYFIPDFTRWKDHDAFERAFARFLNDLQATETPPIPALSKVSGSTKTTPQNPQTVIAAKKRRLEKLEEQAAFKGSNTPPEILMEIEDLREEINRLEE
jgi:hypothetical protein